MNSTTDHLPLEDGHVCSECMIAGQPPVKLRDLEAPTERDELRRAVQKIINSDTGTDEVMNLIEAHYRQKFEKLLDKAILATWNYTGEGYNGEYDGLTHNGGARYTNEEVEAKVLKDVRATLRSTE